MSHEYYEYKVKTTWMGCKPDCVYIKTSHCVSKKVHPFCSHYNQVRCWPIL